MEERSLVSQQPSQDIELIKTSFVVAHNSPRNEQEASRKILDFCSDAKRAGADRAMYNVKVGSKKINGKWVDERDKDVNIETMLEAVRLWKNVVRKASVVHEDERVRRVLVTVIDTESNIVGAEEICIPRTMERKKLKDGEEEISHRMNSENVVVYTVMSPDVVMTRLTSAAIAKKTRKLLKSLLPPALIAEMVEAIEKASRADIKKDPKGAKENLVKAFKDIYINSKMLREYLGHSVETITPEETELLRGTYSALADKQVTWEDVIEEKQEMDELRKEVEAKEKKPKFKTKKPEKRTSPDSEYKITSVEGTEEEELTPTGVLGGGMKAGPTNREKVKEKLLSLAGGSEEQATKLLMRHGDCDLFEDLSEKAAEHLWKKIENLD